MKKFKFNLLGLLVLFVTASAFIACNSDEEAITENLQESNLVQPEFNKDFMLVDGTSYSTDKKDPKIKVTFTIGRKSRKCHGFGICKVKSVTITLKNTESRDDTFAIEEINGIKYAVLKLTNNLDENRFDTNLYVDELISDEETDLSLPEGIYQLDATIGEFGGYRVLLNN